MILAQSRSAAASDWVAKPSGPNTGYGYIQFEDSGSEVKKVLDFTEKPNLETAIRFLEQGDYLWNAGIFIWSVRSILNSFRSNLPQMHNLFSTGRGCWNTQKETAFIDENYSKPDNISIDYGIMEHADRVAVIPVDIGWSDVGSWSSLADILAADGDGNVVDDPGDEDDGDGEEVIPGALVDRKSVV